MNRTVVKTNLWIAIMNSRYAPMGMVLTAVVVVYGVYELSENISRGIDKGYSVGVKFGKFAELQFLPAKLEDCSH